MRASMRLAILATAGAVCAAGGCATDDGAPQHDGAGRQRSSTSHREGGGRPPGGHERFTERMNVAPEAFIHTREEIGVGVSKDSSSVRRVEVVGTATKADGSLAPASFEVFFGPHPDTPAQPGLGELRDDSGNAAWEVNSGWAVMRGWRPRARLPRTTIGSEGTTFVVEITANAEYVYLLDGGPLDVLQHDGTPLGSQLNTTGQYLRIWTDAAGVVQVAIGFLDGSLSTPDAPARRAFLAHVRNAVIASEQ